MPNPTCRCGAPISNVIPLLADCTEWICADCARVPEPPVKPPVPAAILTCETCGDEFEWFRRTTGQKEPRTCPSCAKAAPNTAQARRRAKEAEAKREEADA